MRRTAIAAAILTLTLTLAGCASPAAATVSPACRAWIASELQDGTDSIDADSGHAACGDVTEAQLGHAVDEVLEELMASAAAQ
jgi:hypothetical protein